MSAIFDRGPDNKSCREHGDFLCRGATLFAASDSARPAAGDSRSHSFFTFHANLGLMFLTRGATFPGIPSEFAYPAAFGDLLTAILAFAAIPLVLRNSGLAKPAVWTFNIFGSLDLLTAITFATIYNAPVTTGPAYWIPAFWFHCCW